MNYGSMFIPLVLGLLFLVQSIFIAFDLSSLQRVGALGGSLFAWLGCSLWAFSLYSPKHRRLVKAVAVLLVVAFLGSGATLSAVQFFYERRLETEAKQWAILAQENAKPTWNEDDAARWLTDHGIRAYRGEGSDGSERYYVVDGYRQIEGRGLVTGPTSVHLAFRFDLNHKYQRVEHKARVFEPPDEW